MSAWTIRSRRQCVLVRSALVQRALVMIVHESRQLLAQAFVLFALMTEQDGALEQPVLQTLRQFAPQICGGCAKDQKIAGGNVVDDLIRVMLRHGRYSYAIVGTMFAISIRRHFNVGQQRNAGRTPILSLVCRENNGRAVFVPKRPKACCLSMIFSENRDPLFRIML
jgi:hypothetical protein